MGFNYHVRLKALKPLSVFSKTLKSYEDIIDVINEGIVQKVGLMDYSQSKKGMNMGKPTKDRGRRKK